MLTRIYAPRTFGGIAVGETKYRTQNADNVLQESFRNDLLFSDRSQRHLGPGPRVAVTSAFDTAECAVLFANYTRRSSQECEPCPNHYRSNELTQAKFTTISCDPTIREMK